MYSDSMSVTRDPMGHFSKEEILYRTIDRRENNPFGILGTSKAIIRSKRQSCRAVACGSLFYFFMIFFAALPELSAQSSQSNETREKAIETHQIKGSGGIAGSVRDQQEAAVVGASVKLTDLSTNRVLTTVTNGWGAFQFPSLSTADYSLEISAKGFKTAMVKSVRVTAYELVTQDVALSIGETSEIVHVTSEVENDRLLPQALAALPESVKANAIVVTKEEIEALHPQTIWDVIQQVPGLEVTYQGRQHQEFSNMRGNGNYGVILDGIYLSQTDRFLWTIPASVIESMTIVKDATAFTLGPLTNFGSSTGASNQGFIVIRTKRASNLEGGFVGSYGNLNTEQGHLYQGAKIGNFDYRIAGTYYDTDGKEGWNMASRDGMFMFHGGYTGHGFNGDVLYYTSHGMRQLEWGEILIPTTNKNGSLNWSQVGTLSQSTMNMNSIISDMVAANMARPWGDNQKTTIQYAYDKLHVSVTGVDQDTREQNFGIRHAVNFHNNALAVGGQFLTYISPNGQAPNTGRRIDEDMLGLYVQDEYRMFDGKLSIDGGFRGDKEHFYNSPITGAATDLWAHWTPTYGIGASYKLSQPLTLTARYAYSENGMSSNQVSTTGSVLPPEKRSRVELGLVSSIHPAFNPWITLYYYNTNNQKVSATGRDPQTGKSVSSYLDPVTGDEIDFVTASDVVTGGSEMGISGQFLKFFNYSCSYSFVATDNNSQNQSMSHHLVGARLGYRYKSAFANLSLNYAGPKNLSVSPAGTIYYELGDYTRMDANFGYNFRVLDRTTRITLFGRNLTNNHYATRYVTGAYRDPGLQYGVELAFSFF